MKLMENYRSFQTPADPFGRVWNVNFKYCQTGIAIRHADSVDVGFLISTGDETHDKVVVLNHPDLLAYCTRSGRELSDVWCSRVAAIKLTRLIVNAENMEDHYIPVSALELEDLDAAVRSWEHSYLASHGGKAA